jgi:hypothetical protein
MVLVFENPTVEQPWIPKDEDQDKLFYRLKKNVPLGVIIVDGQVFTVAHVPGEAFGKASAIFLGGTTPITAEQGALLTSAGYGELVYDDGTVDGGDDPVGYGLGTYGTGVYGR